MAPFLPRFPLTLWELISSGAKRFFSFVGEVIVAYDAMPMENRYPLKALMIHIAEQSGSIEPEFFVRDELELGRILGDQGWWILERDFTGPVQRDLLALARAGRQGEVETYILRMFSADDAVALERKVQPWFDNAYLATRKEIIDQCLWAHRSGQYSLAIPTLLSLIDGVTRAYLRKWRGRRSSTKTIQVREFARFYKSKEPKIWSNPFSKIIDDFIYQHFQFDSAEPRTSLNRHGILHGVIPQYGTEANSLRLFLALDTIQNFIGKHEQELAAKKAALVRKGVHRTAPACSP